MRRALLALFFVLLALLLCGPRAAAAAPRLQATPARLVFSTAGEQRDLELRNTGDAPLHITGVSVSGDSAGYDVPSPPTGGAELAPGRSLRIRVSYTPQGPRRQALGALLVFCDDPRGGDDPRTEEPDHVIGVPLSAGEVVWPLALWALPLAVAALLGLVRGERARLHLARGAGLCTLALTGAVLLRFDPAFGVHSGNYGMQLVTHRALAPGLGLEWFSGYDGLSVPLCVCVALVCCAALFRPAPAPVGMRTAAAWLAVLGGALGFLAALDARAALLFWEVALLGLYGVLGGGAGVGQRFFVQAQLGVALLSGALALVHAHSLAGPLVDGTLVPHSWDLIKLSYFNYYGDFRALGRPLGQLAWPALVTGLLLPVALLLRPGVPGAARLWALGPAVLLGGYGVLRLPCGLLPDATAWAARSVAAIGAAWVVAGLWRARRTPDLLRLLGLGLGARAGLFLLGLGGGTHTSLLGAHLTLVQVALAAAALAMAAEAPAGRGRHLGLAAAALCALDLPGTLGGAARLLVLLGSFADQRVLTLLTAAALLAAPLSAWRAWLQVPSPDLARPAQAGAALVWLAVLLAVQLGLGLYPEALAALSRTSLEDLILHGPGTGASWLAALR